MSNLKAKPGLQPERTSISWIRTGLALAVNAILLMRQALLGEHHGFDDVLLGVGILLCLGYFFLFLVRTRYRNLTRFEPGALPLTEIRVTAGLTVLATLSTTVAILTSLLIYR